MTHLELGQLRVVGVPERSVVDDCRVRFGCFHDPVAGSYDLVLFDGAEDFVLSRSHVFGDWSELDIQCETLRVRGGKVNIVGCTIEGDTFGAPGPHAPSFGTGAVRLEAGAHVWIAGSTLRGANGANGDGGAGASGGAGQALFVADGAAVDVRGTPVDKLVGGTVLGDFPGNNAGAIHCAAGAGSVTWSGVALVGSVGPCAAPHASAAPFLVAGGSDGPGLVREVAVTGTAGSVAVLVAAFGAASLDLPLLATTPLWLAPGSEFAFVPLALGGPASPAVVPLAQPPSAAFAGLVVHVQAVEVTALGDFVGTNPAALVLTW